MQLSVRRLAPLTASVGAVLLTGFAATCLAPTATAASPAPVKPVTVTVTAATLTPAHSGGFSARLVATVSSGKVALPKRAVTVQARANSTAVWTTLPGVITTSALGIATTTEPQSTLTEQYRLLVPATAGYAAAVTKAVTLVAPAPTVLKLSAVRAKVTAATKYQDQLTGILTSAKLPLAGQHIIVRQRSGAAQAWVTLKNTLTSSSKGVVTLTVTAQTATTQYQLLFLGTASHQRVASGILTVTRA